MIITERLFEKKYFPYYLNSNSSLRGVIYQKKKVIKPQLERSPGLNSLNFYIPIRNDQFSRTDTIKYIIPADLYDRLYVMVRTTCRHHLRRQHFRLFCIKTGPKNMWSKWKWTNTESLELQTNGVCVCVCARFQKAGYKHKAFKWTQSNTIVK